MTNGRIAGSLPGPAEVVTAIAALGFAWPIAPGSTLAAVFLAALIGGAAGRRIAASRIRTPVSLASAAIAALSIAAVSAFAAQLRWPLLSAESSVALRDALTLGPLAGLAALAIALVVARHATLRALPALLLVLAVAALLAPHRGGSIHRPYDVSDRAWLHGWSPMLALAALGSMVGLTACFAFFRWEDRRRSTWQAVGIGTLAVAVLMATPGLRSIGFADEDPLGLASGDGDRELFELGEDGVPRSPADGDPLGLSERGQGAEGRDRSEMLPFRDDYSQSGAEMPVAVVVLHDDVDPFGGVFYFRQVAFSTWNGRRLVRSFQDGVDDDLFERFPVDRPLVPTSPPLTEGRVRIPSTVSLMREHTTPPALTSAVRLESRRASDPALFVRSYRSDSAVLIERPEALLGVPTGVDGWDEPVRSTYLARPDDPRYDDLVAEAVALLPPALRDDDWARAVAISTWLADNTLYSIRSSHADAPDPTASFLFGDRIGYCVHLAHAAAYLMRAAGLPARVAAGYAYSARDRAGGSSLLLRAGDAHAWAEVHLKGFGWIPVDPSPESIDPPAERPDLDLQRLLGEIARGDEDRLAGQPGGPRGWPSARNAILLLLAAAFATWVATGHAIKLARRAMPFVTGTRHASRWAYAVTLDRLAEAGMTRRTAETRESFAERAATVAPSFAALTRTHLASRFGGHPIDARRDVGLARAVTRELRASGGWRRWLGVAAPWIWTRAR